jgi:hypothetical protein
MSRKVMCLGQRSRDGAILQHELPSVALFNMNCLPQGHYEAPHHSKMNNYFTHIDGQKAQQRGHSSIKMLVTKSAACRIDRLDMRDHCNSCLLLTGCPSIVNLLLEGDVKF